MQRQSLGSPSPSPSPSSNHHHHLLSSEKKVSHRRPDERFVHLIPLLAFLCFLILYLSSHHPSLSEMAEFKKKLQNEIDSIDEMEAALEINKGDILGIRSLRNLQEIDKEEAKASSTYHQLPRKIGDF